MRRKKPLRTVEPTLIAPGLCSGRPRTTHLRCCAFFHLLVAVLLPSIPAVRHDVSAPVLQRTRPWEVSPAPFLPSHATFLPSHVAWDTSHAGSLPSHAKFLTSPAARETFHAAFLPSHGSFPPSHDTFLPSHAPYLPVRIAPTRRYGASLFPPSAFQECAIRNAGRRTVTQGRSSGSTPTRGATCTVPARPYGTCRARSCWHWWPAVARGPPLADGEHARCDCHLGAGQEQVPMRTSTISTHTGEGRSFLLTNINQTRPMGTQTRRQWQS